MPATVVGNTMMTWAQNRALSDRMNRPARIIPILKKFTPLIDDMPVFACNGGTVHDTVWEHAIPGDSWGVLNRGTPVSEGDTTVLTDTTANIAREAAIDQRILSKSKNPAHTKLVRTRRQFMSMSQQAERNFFNGNKNATPDGIHGLAPRYGTISGNPFNAQIVDGAGTGTDNASIWLVGWGEEGVHGIHPEDSDAVGIKHTPREVARVSDSTGVYYIEPDSYEWDTGLAVAHPGAVVRICNIDRSALTINAATGANILRLLRTAYHRATDFASIGDLDWKIYMDGQIFEYLDHHSQEANSNTFLTYLETKTGGKPTFAYRDMPIRKAHMLRADEARVV
jgi:hypothetical protein